jgi:hypothetical protein
MKLFKSKRENNANKLKQKQKSGLVRLEFCWKLEQKQCCDILMAIINHVEVMEKIIFLFLSVVKTNGAKPNRYDHCNKKVDLYASC